jgi:ABC-type nitrate/sulfonate/bicarbonate transport system substrate-binding protein
VQRPQDMKGFRFCVPFDYSMHNYLLRYYLADGGLHPDKDVQIRIVPPPEMLLGELGVGYLTWIEWNNLHIAGILFAILVIGAVGVALDAGFNQLARLVTYPE